MNALNPGDLLLIGPACSPQFTGDRALRLRLVSAGEIDPYSGWMWLTGYVLDVRGDATAKRELYVQRAGIVVERRAPAPTLVPEAVRRASHQTRPRTGRLAPRETQQPRSGSTGRTQFLNNFSEIPRRV
ncbi:hypothetical protein [Micromonospora lupini]|uniref:hypothetical protein n=1 Tax=Micromonospora lupini TaxID=285679 RepID=UPI0031D725B9